MLLYAFAVAINLIAIFSNPIHLSGGLNIAEWKNNFDDSYTLKVNEAYATLDKWDPDKEVVSLTDLYAWKKTYYFKRNSTAKRFQAGPTPETARLVEQLDGKGKIQHYYDWDNQGVCSRYEANCLDGVGRGFDFDDKDKFVNAALDGSKVYLHFYKYVYDEIDLGHYYRYWTTVYDMRSNSYLPFKKDIHYKNRVGWYILNLTYTPTEFEWFKLPKHCKS